MADQTPVRADTAPPWEIWKRRALKRAQELDGVKAERDAALAMVGRLARALQEMAEHDFTASYTDMTAHWSYLAAEVLADPAVVAALARETEAKA